MKEELYAWMKDLAVFYILFTAVIHLVPDKQYERYVRLFMGFLLILLMCVPAVSLLGKSGELLESFEKNFEQENTLREESELARLQEMYEEQVEPLLEGEAERLKEEQENGEDQKLDP
jgi:stage III sporulation protein AF